MDNHDAQDACLCTYCGVAAVNECVWITAVLTSSLTAVYKLLCINMMHIKTVCAQNAPVRWYLLVPRWQEVTRRQAACAVRRLSYGSHHWAGVLCVHTYYSQTHVLVCNCVLQQQCLKFDCVTWLYLCNYLPVEQACSVYGAYIYLSIYQHSYTPKRFHLINHAQVNSLLLCTVTHAAVTQRNLSMANRTTAVFFVTATCVTVGWRPSQYRHVQGLNPESTGSCTKDYTWQVPYHTRHTCYGRDCAGTVQEQYIV
jgi:hypothetical protein